MDTSIYNEKYIKQQNYCIESAFSSFNEYVFAVDAYEKASAKESFINNYKNISVLFRREVRTFMCGECDYKAKGGLFNCKYANLLTHQHHNTSCRQLRIGIAKTAAR